jgi:hypothetical protein
MPTDAHIDDTITFHDLLEQSMLFSRSIESETIVFPAAHKLNHKVERTGIPILQLTANRPFG